MRLKPLHRLLLPAESNNSVAGGEAQPQNLLGVTPEEVLGDAPPAAPSAGEESSVDWLAESELDAGEEGAAPEAAASEAAPAPAAPPASPATPASPAPTPAAATPAAPTTPAAPAAAPAAADTPAAPAPAATETPPAAKTPEQLEAERQAAITALAEAQKKQFDELVDYYKIPDDMAARFQTEPEVVLPQLAAKVHQAIAINLERTLSSVVPNLIRNVAKMDSVEAEARTAFTARWPELVKHEPEVLRIGAIYRQLNPNATRETAIERIGQLVYEALGLTPPAPAAGGASALAAPAAPAAPARPFTPAGGAGGARGPAPAGDNEFEAMAQLMATGEDDDTPI